MKVTNAERLTVALWLSLEWAGDEADLYAFADAWEALELERYRKYIQRAGEGVTYKVPDELAGDHLERTCALGADTARVLLKFLPRFPVSSSLGMPKVRLLRKLRSVVTAAEKKTKPKKPKTEKAPKSK